MPVRGPAVIYVIVAVAAAVGLGLLISFGAGGLFGLTESQTGQLVPLVALLLALAVMMARRGRLPQLMGNLALWAGLFGAVLVGYAFRDDLQGVAARVFGELVPGAAVINAEAGTATFQRDRGGHFEVNATIDGARVPLIFDTGATAVVLSDADARAAGIDTKGLNYFVPVQTANGEGRAASVRLESIEVGGIVRHNIEAFVAEPGALDTSLLGMTYLETLTSYTVSSNALVLTD